MRRNTQWFGGGHSTAPKWVLRGDVGQNLTRGGHHHLVRQQSARAQRRVGLTDRRTHQQDLPRRNIHEARHGRANALSSGPHVIRSQDQMRRRLRDAAAADLNADGRVARVPIHRRRRGRRRADRRPEARHHRIELHVRSRRRVPGVDVRRAGHAADACSTSDRPSGGRAPKVPTGKAPEAANRRARAHCGAAGAHARVAPADEPSSNQ